MTTVTKDRKCDFSKVTVGSKLSMTYHLNVLDKGTRAGRPFLSVEDQNGAKFDIQGKELIEETINSADQFTETETVSRTAAIEVLESAGDTVFTANFNKLPNEQSFSDMLSSVSIGDLNDPKKLKKLAKEAMRGEERTLVGYLVNTEPKMGRSTVIDLETKDTHKLRQVDHRTLNWIIFKNKKYVVK
jgi:hypothetical protein